jgi:ATP/maltotriose-dependent transcriptional regulator MalT
MERFSNFSARLAAKTAPPEGHAAYLRDEQLQRVAEAAEAQLVVVRAPAGYGKTTLVAGAADKLGWQCVWYRLDSSDEDPASLLVSLVAAIRLHRPELAELPTASDSEADDADITAAVFADLTQGIEGHLHLVLDEYDTLASTEKLDETMAALLLVLPPTLRLVVVGRRRPGFASVKLELDGRLVEIGYRDLLLDREQTASAFERTTGFAPKPEALTALIELTEGWPAGVALTAKAACWADPNSLEEAIRGKGLEHAVFSYFAAEVWKTLTTEVQQFLTDTCCLEPVTPELAAAVTGSSQAERLLERLRAGDTFAIPDASGEALRYHPLWRRFLQARVLQEEGAEAYRVLQNRSADALAACGQLSAAIELYLTLGELQSTLAVLEAHGTEALDECDDRLLMRWLEALRSATEDELGWPALVEGRRLSRGGHLGTARELLESAGAALNANRRGRYLAQRALAQHCYVTGRDEEAISHVKLALEAAADRREEAETLADLARVLSGAGRWRDLDEAIAAFHALGTAHPGLRARMASLEAHRAYIAGDVRSALAAAERALPLVRRHGSKEEVANLLNAAATLSLFRAHYTEAWEYLDEALERCGTDGLARLSAELAVTHAALCAQSGDVDKAVAALADLLGRPGSKANGSLRFEALFLRGATLRRAGRLEEAEASYREAQDTLGQGSPLYDRLAVQLDLAFTCHLRGSEPPADLRMGRLVDEAAHAHLLFHYAKARFYAGVIDVNPDAISAEDLVSPCEELTRLGHLDFLGQELAAQPLVTDALAAVGSDHSSVIEALAAVACQTGGPALLASLAKEGERSGLLIVEAVRGRLAPRQRRWLLGELRRHPSRRVRDRARGALLPSAEGRLFPELSPREEEILASLADGETNQAIAVRFSLTLATVKTHVHRILGKLGARGRLAAAVVYRQRATDSIEKAGGHDPGAPSGAEAFRT